MRLVHRVVIALSISLLFNGFCWGQTQGSATSETVTATSDTDQALPMKLSDQTIDPTSQPAPPVKSSGDHPNFHLEAGGYYNSLSSSSHREGWEGGDLRLMYLGLKHFTPIFSVGTQTRPSGTAQAYGFGSYINFNKWFTAVVGVSGSPDTGAILFPKFRYDAMGMIGVPGVSGLLITPGYTHYQMAGGTASVTSIGAIYYHGKYIVSAGMGFNKNHPGDMSSVSGQFGLMYGRQGHYYLGGGVRGGNLAYQLISSVPFDVRLNAYGSYFFFQKWIGRHWGLTERYEYGNVIDSYRANAVSVSVFYDF
jgi:YaiO family outer membrane protein